ncbi:MAG: polyphosphate polymerase domain-containing protein [Flavobacteriales bacterium]
MEVLSALNTFDPISLNEMDEVKLQNRVDTKYVFSRFLLAGVLHDLMPYYRVLEIDNHRLNHYHSVYYDTDDLLFFRKHLNGKMNRYKVRMRKYLDSGLCYLEIKFKNNKRRTIKSRKKKPDLEQMLSEQSLQYVEKKSDVCAEGLRPSLWNSFSRITLVHKEKKERLTIDLDLRYGKDEEEKEVKELVIAELKQEKFSVLSDFVRVMKKYHIRPMRISKYCLGIALLYQHVKNNRFKPRMLHILKVTHGNAFRYPLAG